MINLVGQRYGKLLAMESSGNIEKSSGSKLWICQCDCGNTTEVSARYLRKNGLTKSCGCVQTVFVDYSYEKEIIRRYKYGAKGKGRIWELSDEYALSLIRSPCYYCGGVEMRRRGERKSGASLLINGIDRMDSSRGYEYGNVVPCCSKCNFRKKSIPHD